MESQAEMSTNASIMADTPTESKADLDDLINDLDDILAQVDEIDQAAQNAARYGMADRFEVVKNRAGGMWSGVKGSLGTFFKKLTTTTNGRLPDWVYTASEGVLQSMINFVEERMAKGDDKDSVTVEMLRQGINALRARIIEASKTKSTTKKIEASKPDAPDEPDAPSAESSSAESSSAEQKM